MCVESHIYINSVNDVLFFNLLVYNIDNKRANIVITIVKYYDQVWLIRKVNIEETKYLKLENENSSNIKDIVNIYNIFSNVACVLSNINNMFSDVNSELQGHKDFVKINISGINIKIINDARIEDSDYINSCLIIATLYRIKFITIINNALRGDSIKKQGEFTEKLKFTKGNTLALTVERFRSLSEFFPTNKKYRDYPVEVKYNKDISIIRYFLDNKSYSHNIWIQKERKYINLEKEEYLFLSNISSDNCVRYLFVLNLLNEQKLCIEKEIWYLFINNIKNKNSYKKLLEAYNKKTKAPDYLSTKNISDFANIRLVEMEVNQIITRGFYYCFYKLDLRYRIYIDMWPMNYQLFHIVRYITKINVIENYKSIYLKFFDYLRGQNLINQFSWKHTKFLDSKEFINFIKDFNIKLDLNLLKSNQNIHSEEYINEAIKCGSLINSMLALAPKDIITHYEKVLYVIKNINKILSTEHTSDANTQDIINNDELCKYKDILILKNVMLGNFDFVNWLDASSNALQLIILSSGTKNELLLKLLNIINNDTEYRNIYVYVWERVKGLEIIMQNDICKKIVNEFSYKLIKSIIMPMAYGKTKWSAIENIKEELKKGGISVHIDTIGLNKACELLYDCIIKELVVVGVDIEKHLKLCLKKFNIRTFRNHNGLPLINTHLHSVNRYEIMKVIDNIKSVTKSLKSLDVEDASEINEKNFDFFKLMSKYIKKRKLNKSNCLIELANKLDNTNKALKKTDEFTIKKKIYILGKDTYQIRVDNIKKLKKNNRKIKSAYAPNITHTYDSSILFNTLYVLKMLGITALCIHDSIGVNLPLSEIVSMIYKIELVKTIQYNIKNGYTPYEPDIQFPKGLDLYNEIYKSESLFS